MRKMLKTTRYWLWISALCASCTAHSPLMVPEATPTMIEIYQRHAVPTMTEPSRKRQEIETARTEQRMPLEAPSMRGPVIHMYVFPHQSETDGVRIPGYWTSFELYERFESRPDRSKE